MAKQKETIPEITNKDKYEYLIKARNFHYENFSKWLSYFYVAIAALFVAYYSVAKEQEFADQHKLEKLILMLGYLVSLYWYWSSKGYYYWNINFITLVNYYETEVFKWPPEGRVYAIFANKKRQNCYGHPVKGANISTSKVAILFGYTVSLFWGFLLSSKLFGSSLNQYLEDWACPIVLIAGSISTTLILSHTVARFFLFSKTNHMADLNLAQLPLNRDQSNA